MTDREKAIEILQRLADGKAEELDIFDDEGGGVCGQILEEQDAILAGIEALKAERPHGECKVYHAMFEDRIACKCRYMNVITGKWNDYNYCPRCGRMAQKEGDE